MKGLRVLAVLAWLSGCATDVGPIDRTQHDKLEKKLFAGVWYMTQTVIDTPYNAAFTFVGETNFGQTGKVIFDIQEKTLVVYPVSEYVEGSEAKWRVERIFKYWDDACLTRESEQYQCVDGKDNFGKPDQTCCFVEVYVGQPVAAFEIVSHFDVQRQYNAQTGEQSNVLEENTTDRKWWQRRYIRVNWAKNLVQDFTFMARLVEQKAVDYYVQTFEADNPDAPTLTPDYIDVVTKTWGTPASTGACSIYGISTGDCASALIKFRTAFRKVDPNNDYEPLRFHNEEHQQYFGYFLTERNAYDEDWGLNESGRISYINRWNIWWDTMDEQDVFLPDGKPKPCFKDLKDTGCDTTNRDGSREFCKAQDWFTRGQCVLRTPKPYTQRGLRPIVFHSSANTPEEFHRTNLAVAKSWSEAFKDTVAWLYLWEEKGMIVGQAHSRVCYSDADCAGHAVLDTWVELDAVSDPWLWPYTLSQTSCIADKDCPSKMCDPDAKRCRNVQWSAMARTLVVTTGSREGVVVPDWGVRFLKNPTVDSQHCAVRLINLGQGPVDLTVGGSVVFSGVAQTASTSDPRTPDHLVLDASDDALQVGAGTATLDGFVCRGNEVTTFVYTGSALYASTVPIQKVSGLRVINATEQALDISLNGGLRFANLPPGGSTGYQEVGGGASGQYLPADFVRQRVVAVPAFSRGDLTCYFTESFSGEPAGRCVGYKPPVDWQRYEEIRASLPEMFVMCRNQYDPASDDQYASDKYAPWALVKTAQPGSLPMFNPCVDGLFRADKMTEEEKLAQARAMKKIGDSRYSMIYWIPDAQIASPLGYGPSAADPDTGEIFWGTANIYGAFIYFYGALYRDLFELISGRLDTQGYVTGQTIRDYLASKTQGEVSSGLTQASQDTPPPEVLGQGVPAEASGGLAKKGFGVTHQEILREILKVIRDKNLQKQVMSGLPVRDPSAGRTRLQAIRGTPLEDMLITDEVKWAASQGRLLPGDALSPEEASALSPLNWATLDQVVKKERERQALLSSHNYCFADFNDEGILGQAKEWSCAPDDPRPECPANWDPLDHANDYGNPCCFRDGQRLASATMLRFYKAIAEHEVGHTVGLRHNFEGSADLFNYHDEYFDVREKEPIPCTIDDECEGVFGQRCVGGVCQIAYQTSCSKASDCGATDMYDCVGGQCVELKRCGLKGECGAGEVCNGDQWLCYKDGVRVEMPMVVPDDPVVRQFIPRPGLTPNEAARSRTIYQYSTVMDYGQRFNSDVLGLGKYDHAAIRFGYGQLMDVYEDLSTLTQNLYKYARAYGYTDTNMSDMLDSSYWSWGVYFSQLYFLQNYLGVDANRSQKITLPDGTVRDFSRNRAAVPYEWIKLEHAMNENYYRQQRDWSYVVVPYKFCGDEYAGNMGCYTWDTGMDPAEIMHNFRISLTEYYLVDAFKRERYGFGLHGDPMSYFSRILSRYMDPMQDAAMYYALFAHILKGYGWRGIWANARMMGWSLRRASEEAFETLASALTSPAPGSFRKDPATNVYRNISYDQNVAGEDLLRIPLGEGKYPYTVFADSAGYNYYDHALWIGSFWEKLAAIMTLTDSTVYFTSNYVGEQLNIGVGTSMGFNTMYPRQLIDLFGGVVTGDLSRAAWLVKGGQATRRPYFDPKNSGAYAVSPMPFQTPAALDPTTPVVEPSMNNLTLKLYALVYGMAYLPASFDPSFLDAFSLCLEGSQTCMEVSALSEVQVERFTDPFGGKTYVAWGTHYGSDWYQPNLVLVQKANALKAQWEAASGADKARLERDLREVIETLDLVRRVWDIYSAMKI